LAAEFHLSAVAAGALTTVPVLCMGLFAPVASIAAHRLGETAVLAGAVGLIALGAGLRAAPGVGWLFAGTAVAGLGIAVGGALLPTIVRSGAPDRVGPVTGLYTAALIGGALLAAGGTEPLRTAFGLASQTVLGLWALPALAAGAVWLTLRWRTSVPQRTPAISRVRIPWRSRAAWLGTAFMGAQSLLFYGTLAWLAAAYTDRGMTTHEAGLLLALFSATQVVSAFGLPALADRFGSPRAWTGASIGLTTLALFLVALAPTAFPAAPWLWAGLVGLGMGGNLSMALVVLTRIAPSPREASAYTGMAFLFGYLLAAVGPVALGTLTDATGGYRVPFLALALFGIVTTVVGVVATPRARPAGAPS
jgi:CP family cyanate transporter-like MFS transporter